MWRLSVILSNIIEASLSLQPTLLQTVALLLWCVPPRRPTRPRPVTQRLLAMRIAACVMTAASSHPSFARLAQPWYHTTASLRLEAPAAFSLIETEETARKRHTHKQRRFS